MVKLIENTPSEENNRPHLLSGNYSGFWECHIKPDWLLIYQFF
ncbi:MAG: type II toxin-antitoxin system YafQ family toxin [Moraxella sp.]|nr:type II toxin-antitoxin system YafQ family toxin [Moraxella sp.]